MPLFHLFLVAVIQGLTEFLPVSSSGHLILLPGLSGLDDQGQIIDVAAHVGSLAAVILYFRADVKDVFRGLPRLLTGRADTADSRLTLLLVIATVPVVVLGLVVKVTGLDSSLRSIAVIGWMTLIFGIVLYWSDHRGATIRTGRDWTRAHALQMGLWQMVALVPGTSRSGITITAARFLGYDRREAVRLSMLMSIPTIAASGFLLGGEMAVTVNLPALRDAAIAAILAFGAALLALSLMMRLLRSVNFTPYVIYRMILGAVLLGIAYS